MDTVEGKVAFITGGGSGIGRGTALTLARAGAHVVVADVNEERTREVAAEASEVGAEAAAFAIDVNSQAAFDEAREFTLERFGRIDIVMNNVGVIAIGLPEVIPMSEWERVISTNLLSVVRSNATFLPVLLEQGSGHVVNTASMAGLMASAFDRLPYSATKAAVVAISESLAIYLTPKGIGVTCLCPGPTATNISEQISFSGPQLPMRGPQGVAPTTIDVVGEQVLAAILDNRFLLLTHPELQEALIARAMDPEAFVAMQVARDE